MVDRGKGPVFSALTGKGILSKQEFFLNGGTHDRIKGEHLTKAAN